MTCHKGAAADLPWGEHSFARLRTFSWPEARPMTRTCVLFAISVGLLVLAATAQNATVKRLDGSTITPAEIDAMVARVIHAAEVPGAAIALFNDEKVAYLKTYGVRDKDQNLPLTADSA